MAHKRAAKHQASRSTRQQLQIALRLLQHPSTFPIFVGHFAHAVRRRTAIYSSAAESLLIMAPAVLSLSSPLVAAHLLRGSRQGINP